MKSRLETAINTGDGFNVVCEALIENTRRMGDNFKNLASAVKVVGSNSTKSFKSVGSTLKRVGKNLFNVKNMANAAADALERMVNTIGPIVLIVKTLQMAGNAVSNVFTGAMESLELFNNQVSVFSQMLNNDSLGKALADDMNAFGEQTTFTSEAISSAAQTMLSYGASASEVSQRMRMFGEAAGNSSEGLTKLAEIYSKVEASNKIAVEDLEALRSVGVYITDILAKEAGVASDELLELASKGRVGFDELSGALKKATAEGGKFYGNTARGAKNLSEAQLQTSKLSSKLFLELGKAFEPLMIGFEKTKQWLMIGILVPITKATASVITFTKKLTDFVGYVGGKTVEWYKFVFNLTVGLWKHIGNFIISISNKMKDFVGYISTKFVEGFKFAVQSVVNLFAKIKNSVVDVFDKMKEFVVFLATKIVEGFKSAFSPVVNIFVNVKNSVVDFFTQIKDLANYVATKFVEKFRAGFEPIISLFQTLKKWSQSVWDTLYEALSMAKGKDKKIVETVASSKIAPDLMKDDSSNSEKRKIEAEKRRIDNLNKQMIAEYETLQQQIFKMQREVFIKPLHEQEKATRDLQSIVNAKNKEFVAKYGKNFDILIQQNQQTLANIEKQVNDFAKSNHHFVNEHKDLQAEIARLNQEVLMLPYEQQESKMKELANVINAKQQEFVNNYSESFHSLNESNQQLLAALKKGVDEFEKTTDDRAFVEAHKALQDKVQTMQFKVLMKPLKEQEKAAAEMEVEVKKLYSEFVKVHKELFDSLNDANKSSLIEIAEKAQTATESLLSETESLFDTLYDALSKLVSKALDVVTKVVNKDLGKSVAAGNTADTVTQSLFDVSKDMLASFGPWGALGAAALDFTVGLFQGFEQQRIKEVEERRDQDLKELEKQSEIAIMRLEEGFDNEISMRKEKLSQLDEQYNKEIAFLKQAQSKGQISGEEFQRRIRTLENEHQSKKQQETQGITNAETSKKVELERKRKLKDLEAERIKAQAEVDKVKVSNWSWNQARDLDRANTVLEEILKRISKVKSANFVEEIKLANKGARFITTRPTFMPGAGLMTSEFGQNELVRVTPAPIDQNLRNFEARIIAEEISKIQKSEGSNKGHVIVNNYNFNGDVLDADKLVRMLKEREHAIGFRMSE
ncbi:Putative membrane spanning protein (plasmid) [Borrelia crocidurae DOU]|uniref:Putative membrane spanning protein n=1 Tax=Borrelia crocidurae DOU TaxID=1293575 RepID=W5SKI5_9SPIR|nr:tape measure protein [Borrelia crocidurae]AHH07178.1 Putative membrane spanning protein [Borrelia crocidurae DOU]